MHSLEALPKPVAFAFSGGVALGAIQVGMLQAVSEAGIMPDLVIGSSAGAFNAAFVGRGFNAERVRDLGEVWRGVKRSDVFGYFGLRRIVNILAKPTALVSSEALLKFIAANFPSTYDHQSIPTFVTATDYLSGEALLLSRDDLQTNLLASSSIPLVFPPVLIEGRYLIDGSVSAHVPLLPAEKLGARTLVVFDVGYPCNLRELPRNPLDRALHVFSIMLHRQPTGALSALARDTTVLYLPSPCPLSVPSYDFSKADSLMESGYGTAKRFLDDLSFSGPGIYGHFHTHAGS